MNEKRYLIRENNGRFNPRLSKLDHEQRRDPNSYTRIDRKLNVRWVDENLVRSDLLLKS